MARERLDTLQEIAYESPDPESLVGYAQIQRPDGRNYYAAFVRAISVEEGVIALIEDELRMGEANFHVVRIPPILAAIDRRLMDL